MKALRLERWQTKPVLRDVEVLVQVGAGACHSDLHLMHDFEPGLLPWGPRSRSATRTPAGCTRSAPGSAASSRDSRRGRRRLGLRPVPPLPGRPGDLLRGPSAPVPGRRRWPRPRRRDGGVPARP